MTVHTEININAPAERVWNILTDLASYRDWNPMIRRAGGEIRQGARLTIHFNPRGTKGRIFHPKLLVVEPNRELRWQGQPEVPFLIESEHFFIIRPMGGGSVRLDHDMMFHGLIIPIIKNFAVRTTEGPFNDMNRALKERAEH
ncbi:MAG: SRPBCC domain-containing protein [Spirochaetes bacterium]|nr:SRPBCC domain-containing protein [Spirochaetota bacterium]